MCMVNESNEHACGAWISPDFHVTLELEPVGDSDEIAAAWMAKSPGWLEQLRRGLSPDADLECCDPGAQAALDAAHALVYERGE